MSAENEHIPANCGLDKGILTGRVEIRIDDENGFDFVIVAQDGDYHVDFDDGYYRQCMAEKLDGKTVRLGYYSMETNSDGTRWAYAGDDNTLEEIEVDEPYGEDASSRRILKRPPRTINNVVKEVKKEEKKEVTVVKKMEDQKQENSQRKKVFFKIIVPNYNNYLYIKKCLDSIKEQTFKDYVCIVVDDLSTDDSFKIAQIYAKRDPEHFVAIKVDKKGHEGGARNKGIDYPIDCEYYYFVDSDDYLHDKEVLKDVNKQILKNFPEILFVKMMMFFDSNPSKNHIIRQPKFRYDDIKLFLCGFNSACIKFISSKKIVKFLENCDHAADVYQTIKLFDQKPSVEQFDRIAYNYRRNDNSVTLNGRYKEDTKLFYSKIEELSKTIKNTDILNAVLYRIKKYNNGEISF